MRLGATAVGALLAKLVLTPQKPLQRAYQRDPEAIERWQRDTYQAIARQAKAQGAEVFFWDESGFRADTVHGRTWSVRGKTPVVQRPGQRQSISAASAINAKGAFWFCPYQGALNAELFVELLKKMLRHRKKPVHLVLDSLPAHKKALVREYVDSTSGKLTPHFLPGSAPETSWCGAMSNVLAPPGVPCKRARSYASGSRSNSPTSRISRVLSVHSSTLHLSPIFPTAE